jgi:multicomponent K+:H+ antiporter subunit D
MQSISAFWQAHFPILSILLPAFTGILLVLLGNSDPNRLYQDWRQAWRRGISLGSALLGLLLALLLLNFSRSGQIAHYELSEWSAPFGIVLVVDRLSALMVLLSYGLLLPLLWYASAKWDLRGRYFHAMSHFLLMGVCGAFLTGDLFNLFVFFEILLMASYVLLLHAQGKARFSLGIHYVIINLLASAFFLIGLGLIYANVGSLNMADVARLLPDLPTRQHQLALAGALLLLLVFCIKAAIFPVGFWLPKTYAVAATPVAAIFALMTKVGIYAILRVNATVFGDAQGQQLLQQYLLPIGILTSLYGVVAAMGAERLRRMIGFMVTSSLGTLLIGISLFNPQAWAASLYYLVHSTLIAAVFYLYSEWLSRQRGAFKDHLKVAPMVQQQRCLGLLYLVIAMLMAGFPPFSGFIGKLLLLQATAHHPQQIWIMLLLLVVSMLSLLVLVRNGLVLFWRASAPAEDDTSDQLASAQSSAQDPRAAAVIYLFLAALLLYVIAAEPMYRFAAATAAQLMNKSQYQDTILKKNAQQQVISVAPYAADYVPETLNSRASVDRYQAQIPYIISPKTLAGEHISPHPPVSPTPVHSAERQAKLLPAE